MGSLQNEVVNWICCCLVTKLFLTPCDLVDCSLPGFFVHGISHARLLEGVVISFSRGPSWPRDQTCVSCLAGGFFIAEQSQKPHLGFVVVQSLSCVQFFATPWMRARQASLSFTISQSLLKLMSTESVMPSKHLILCHPLLLLPSIFPSIRVFSNELALHIRWPKYWSLGPNPMTGDLRRRDKRKNTHVKTEIEIGAMQPQAKDCWSPLQPGEETRDPSQGACPDSTFGLPASRTVRE